MKIGNSSIVSIENVSLTYRSLPGGQRSLKGYIVNSLSKGRSSLVNTKPQLIDISFEVRKGEQIGIIGRNGAGKSTLLKLIAGVLRPDNGTLNVNGTITPLIDLGTGMQGELNLIENIQLSGAYLGWKPSETRARIEPILAWAELEEMANKPFHTLSTGMQSRLAFSISTLQNPDIVLIDEILAVGDISFQEKSVQRMNELRRNGSASLLVSHDLNYIRDHTERVLWISNGVVYRDGESKAVVREYESSFHI